MRETSAAAHPDSYLLCYFAFLPVLYRVVSILCASPGFHHCSVGVVHSGRDTTPSFVIFIYFCALFSQQQVPMQLRVSTPVCCDGAFSFIFRVFYS